MFKFLQTIILSILLFATTNLCLTIHATHQNSWALPSMARWAEEPSVQDQNIFNPDQIITRGDFALILGQLSQIPKIAVSNPFVDMGADSPYADAVLSLHHWGVILGNGTHFYGDDPITREEASAMLVRLLYLHQDGSSSFLDSSTISPWAKKAVDIFSMKGYLQGYPNGLFQPKKDMVSSECWVLLDRLFGNIYNQSANYSQTIPGNLLVSSGDATLRDVDIEGDLLITSQGSNVTLHNVTVQGDMIIRTENTHFQLSGNTSINRIEIMKNSKNVTIEIQQPSSVDEIYIQANGTSVKGTGSVNSIYVNQGIGTKVDIFYAFIQVAMGAGDTQTPNGTMTGGSTSTIKIPKPTESKKCTVSVVPSTVEAMVGDRINFESQVDNFNQSPEVIWSIDGKTSPETSMSPNGILTIGENETAKKLTVIATADANCFGKSVVNIHYNLANGLDEQAYTADSYWNQGTDDTPKLYPSYAFNGNTTGTDDQLWAPGNQATTGWLQVDFGTETTFNTLKLYESTHQRVSEVDIQIASTENQWQHVETIPIHTPSAVEKTIELTRSVTARFVRITFTSPQFSPHIEELEIYHIPRRPKPQGMLELELERISQDAVLLSWNPIAQAMGYHIYSTPHQGSPQRLNEHIVTDTSFAATNLSPNTVHTLKVVTVSPDGIEYGTENEKKIAITEAKDLTHGLETLIEHQETLQIPVSDFADHLQYLGPTIYDNRYHYESSSSILDKNGKTHLFMARSPKKKEDERKSSSEIVHFVGDTMEGPFLEVGTPFSPASLPDGQLSAYNPRLVIVDETYVLLYTVVLENNSEAIAMATTNTLPTFSDNIEQWNLSGNNGIIMSFGHQATNASLLKTMDKQGVGTYVLYFTENPEKAAGNFQHFYATSPLLDGPYTLQSSIIDDTATLEYPHIFQWKSKFFMLANDSSGEISGTGEPVGILIPSYDPYLFSLENAYIAAGLFRDYVTIPAGATEFSENSDLEKPYVHFVNGTPAYITASTSLDVNGNYVNQSYTFGLNTLPKHTVSVMESIGGSIQLEKDLSEYQLFDDVILTVTPDTHFHLSSLHVQGVDAMGLSHSPTIEPLKDGTYRFMMPSGDVEITAHFQNLDENKPTAVTITPTSPTVEKGQSLSFSAQITGNGTFSQEVLWTLEGAMSETTLTQDGLLSVDANETANTLSICATSVADTNISASTTVKETKEIGTIKIAM